MSPGVSKNVKTQNETKNATKYLGPATMEWKQSVWGSVFNKEVCVSGKVGPYPPHRRNPTSVSA